MSVPFDVIEELSSHRKALTVMQVASTLGLSKQTVYQQIKSGKLPALQFGTTVRLNPRAVAEWANGRHTVEVPLRKAA
jgi:excisionase family DNA binding protein